MSDLPEKPGYWAVIPAAVRYDETIQPNAKLLYAEISSLTGQDGYCWATNSYFRNVFGFSERTIRDLLKSLREAGFIRIEDGGSKKRKIFAGLNPLAGQGKEAGLNPAKICRVAENEPGENLPGNPAKICRHTNIKSNNIPPIAPQGAGASKEPEWKPERFAKFWEYYRPHDRRGNRQRAAKAWDRLKPDDETLCRMAAGLKLQMQGEEWQRGIGIPHVSTWLNNRYWEDALEIADEEDDSPSGWAEDPEVMAHV